MKRACFLLYSPLFPSCITELIPDILGAERNVGTSIGTSISNNAIDRQTLVQKVISSDPEALELLKRHISLLIQQTKTMEKEANSYEKMCGIGRFSNGNANQLNSVITWGTRTQLLDGINQKITTCSPLQECELMVFNLGCSALTHCIKMVNIGETTTSCINMVILAIQCFKWRLSVVPTPNCMEYDLAAPPYMQLYVCQALYHLSSAINWICQLKSKKDIGLSDAPDTLKLINMVKGALTESVDAVENTKSVLGSDFTRLISAINHELACYTLWGKTYNALAHFHNKTPGIPLSSIEIRMMETLNETKALLNNVDAKAEIDRLSVMVASHLTTYSGYNIYRSVVSIVTRSTASAELPEIVHASYIQAPVSHLSLIRKLI